MTARRARVAALTRLAAFAPAALAVVLAAVAVAVYRPPGDTHRIPFRTGVPDGPVGFVARAWAGGCCHPGDPRLPEDRARWATAWRSGPTAAAATGAEGGSRASAGVNLPHTPGIRLNGSIAAPPAGHGDAFAAGQWVDVVRWAGPGPAPGALRLRVTVDGTLSLDLVENDLRVLVGVTSYADHHLVSSQDPEPDAAGTVGVCPSSVSLAMDSAGGPAGRPTYHVAAGNAANLRWAGWAPEPGATCEYEGAFPLTAHVRWEAYLDLPYSAELGGYRLNLYATAKVIAQGGSTAAFRGTVRLTRVALPDGSPAPGPLTFDSGFAPIPVGP